MRILFWGVLAVFLVGACPASVVAQDGKALYAEAQRTIVRLTEIDPGDRSLVRRGTAHLANVLRDLLLYEARATDGKVGAPPELTARPGSAVAPAAAPVPGDVVPLSQVPADWLILQVGTAQDQTQTLLREIDQNQVSAPDIAAALMEIRTILDDVVRPPRAGSADTSRS